MLKSPAPSKIILKSNHKLCSSHWWSLDTVLPYSKIQSGFFPFLLPLIPPSPHYRQKLIWLILEFLRNIGTQEREALMVFSPMNPALPYLNPPLRKPRKLLYSTIQYVSNNFSNQMQVDSL